MTYENPAVAAAALTKAQEHYRDQARLSQWPTLVRALEQIVAQDNRAGGGAITARIALVGTETLK